MVVVNFRCVYLRVPRTWLLKLLPRNSGNSVQLLNGSVLFTSSVGATESNNEPLWNQTADRLKLFLYDDKYHQLASKGLLAGLTRAGVVTNGRSSHLLDSKSQNVCNEYMQLLESLGTLEEKLALFKVVVTALGRDKQDSMEHIASFDSQKMTDYWEESLVKANLIKGLTPLYVPVLSVLGRMSGGLELLMKLRENLISCLKNMSEGDQGLYLLKELNDTLYGILAHHCSYDVLDTEKVTWQSPSDLIEKISVDEAVHPVRHWRDIKNRLGRNMRCFILTHRGLPREPLVVIHSALTVEASHSVQDLLLETNRLESYESFQTAVFYSVWLRKQGLAGMDLPNYLLKSAVRELKEEFPHMKVFYTLSPIPGFRKWLNELLTSRSIEDYGELLPPSKLTSIQRVYPAKTLSLSLKNALDDFPNACSNDTVSESLKCSVLKLCAHYLVNEKQNGQALNSVAKFHLRNGASIWKINWLADRSVRGIQRSYGLMANYRYDVDRVNSYTQDYEQNRTVKLSEDLHTLLKI